MPSCTSHHAREGGARSSCLVYELAERDLHAPGEEGDARETVTTEYAGEETEIGFNAVYLQDFLNVVNGGTVSFEFKDGNSQAQLRVVPDDGYDYRYVVMPMRL